MHLIIQLFGRATKLLKLDDQVRDGGTNFILRIKEQETGLNLHEYNDDDDKIISLYFNCKGETSTAVIFRLS
jgi:hypothetical protein